MGYLFFEESNVEFSVFHNELSKEGDISKKQRDNSQTKGNSNSSINIQDIKPFIFHNEPLRTKEISSATIANTISVVNTDNFFNPLSLEKLGTITTAANQPAARLTNKSEITDRSTGSIDSTLLILVKDKSDVNEGELVGGELTMKKQRKIILRESFSCPQGSKTEWKLGK